MARKELLFYFSFLLSYLLIKDINIKSLFIFLTFPLCILIWEPVYIFSFFLVIEIINYNCKNIKEILIHRIYIFIPSIIIAFYIIFKLITVENHEIMKNYLKINFNENCYMSCGLLTSKSTIYQQFNPLI